MKILVSGSVAFDLLLGSSGSFPDLIDPTALDRLSVAFLAPHFARHHGGTGANTAWNLALLGVEPLLVATVGRDGGEYLSLLRDRGVPADHVDVVNDAVTATAIVATDAYEHQITFFHPGADAKGTFPDLRDDREDIAYAICAPRDARLTMEAVRWCNRFKVPYLFDPGQGIGSLSDDELRFGVKESSGVIANAYEWELLRNRLHVTGEDAPRLAPFVIVTQGEGGAVLHTGQGAEIVPACPPDRVINPTGAGDALRAGVLAGLMSRWTLAHAVRLGCSMGSFAVEVEGTLMDHLDLEEVWSRAEETYGERLPALK